jgi:hypothetical protein
MSPSSPNCFNLWAYPWGKSCKFVGSAKGANPLAIVTRGFWLEGKVCDVTSTEERANGTDLLGLATEVF